MIFFDKNKTDKSKCEENVHKEENEITSLQLNQNDMMILEKMELLQNTIEGMDKNNKKFLMISTMNDDRVEHLEKKMIDMKLEIIDLLDQIDNLMTAIDLSDADDLKNGLNMFYNNVMEKVTNLGIEVLNVMPNMKFDPRKMDCKDVVWLEEYEDEVVVKVYSKGYKDIYSGNVLRYASVSENKRGDK